jgi:hypothetical protein
MIRVQFNLGSGISLPEALKLQRETKKEASESVTGELLTLKHVLDAAKGPTLVEYC